MAPRLFTPARFAIVSVPALGFFAIPFLPFATRPTLWLGLPAVLVWSALMVLLSVAALQLVELLYRRSGGEAADSEESERFASRQADGARNARVAPGEEEGGR